MEKRIKTGSIDNAKTISFDAENFIESCEEKYKISTDDFLKKYEQGTLEINSEMKLWYKFAKDI